jgi:hypothetical protein
VRKCSKSERTIQGCIKRLVDEGHLTRREVVGKGCNYTVHPNRSRITPAENAPRNSRAPAGNSADPRSGCGQTVKNPQSEAKASSQRVVDHYNLNAEKYGWSKAKVLDASRRQTLRLRIKAHGVDALIEAINAMAASPFLRGEGRDSKWRPDFDFLLQPVSLRRLLEGFYGVDPAAKPEMGVAERLANLRRVLPLYERDGHHQWAAQARRMIADLERENPDACEVAGVISKTAAARVA